MPEDHQNERPKSPPEGDDRTPDKTIGQVKYAAGQEKPQQGATGKPQASNLEPEKQGSTEGPDEKLDQIKPGFRTTTTRATLRRSRTTSRRGRATGTRSRASYRPMAIRKAAGAVRVACRIW